MSSHQEEIHHQETRLKFPTTGLHVLNVKALQSEMRRAKKRINQGCRSLGKGSHYTVTFAVLSTCIFLQLTFYSGSSD
jgi:hypothetical protein